MSIPTDSKREVLNSPGVTFSIEKANFKKPGSEHGGDKVWANFNGSGVDVDGMGGEGGDFLAARIGGYALNKRVEALPINCSIDEAAKAIRQGFIDAGHAIREGRKKGGEFGGMDAVGDAIKICASADNKSLFLVLGHVGDTRTCIYRAETEIPRAYAHGLLQSASLACPKSSFSWYLI